MKALPFYRISLIGALAIALCPCELGAQPGRPMGLGSAPDRPMPVERPDAVRAERVHRAIREFRAAGKHEEADRLQARFGQLMHQRHDKMPPGGVKRPDGAEGPGFRREDFKREEFRRDGSSPVRAKMMHLKEAAEHLQAAGYADQAQKAREEIRRLDDMARREAESHKAMEMKRGAEGKTRDGEAKPKSDPAEEIRGELKKLRHEMEEIRQQLRKMKGESESQKKPAE